MGFNWNNRIPKTGGLTLMVELVELGESEKAEEVVDGNKAEEATDELHPEIKFDECPENIIDVESTIMDAEEFQIPTKEVRNNVFRSILPPDVFKSFAGFF
ncbi:hypothetical protein Hanom_Chr04g00334871 [Helianthus anomalus]